MSSPVEEFLDDMRTGAWSPEEEDDELEADEQITCYSWFLKACKKIANTGQPVHRHSFNQLQNGIWELKHINLRISFYDTDGTGNYEPFIDRDSYKGTYASRPWPDGFDEYLRLTTAFGKLSQDRHIVLAQEVREEDLEHDRN